MLSMEVYVQKESLRLAGVPILNSDLDAKAFKEEILDVALVDYFIRAPFEIVQSFNTTGATQFPVSIPDPSKSIPKWPAEAAWEFVGLTGFNFTSGAPLVSVPGLLPGQLEFILTDVRTSMEQLQYSEVLATVRDKTLGDEMFTYDSVTQVLTVFAPGAGKLGIGFGYRLDNIKYVRPSHVIVLAKIAARKFLELLIAGRSSVVLSADVSLDVSFLQSRLDKIDESYDDDLSSIALPILAIG